MSDCDGGLLGKMMHDRLGYSVCKRLSERLDERFCERLG